MKRNLLFAVLICLLVSITMAADRTKRVSPSVKPKRIRPVHVKQKKPTLSVQKNTLPKSVMTTKFTPTYLMTGHPNQYYVSSDLQNWQTKAWPETIKPFNPMGVAAADPMLFVMVGHGGKVVVSQNACSAMQLYSVGEDVQLSDVCYLAKNTDNPTPKFIAVGSVNGSGRIYVSSDNGQSWQKVKTVSGDLKVVAGNNKNQAAAVGPGGYLYTHDGGQTWQDATWQPVHIPMTANLGNIYDVIWDPYKEPSGQYPQQPRFVFVMYGRRDEVQYLNFRYSLDGASWEIGHEDLSTLDGTRRNSVENSNSVASRRVVSNGKGRLITHPRTWPGTYYSDDGAQTWRLYYYNLDPAWNSLMDVTCDGQQFVALAYNPTPTQDRIVCTSPTGETWTPITVPKANSLSAKKITVGYNK